MGKCVVVMLLVVISSAVSHAGQDPPVGQARTAPATGQWANVRSLATGSRLRIRGLDGQLTNGELQSVGDDRLTMLSRGLSREVQQSSIRRIDRQAGRATRQGALKGLLIGVAVGTLQGGLLVETNRQFWVPAFAAGWGGIGAMLGALDGWGRPRFVQVYQAP